MILFVRWLNAEFCITFLIKMEMNTKRKILNMTQIYIDEAGDALQILLQNNGKTILIWLLINLKNPKLTKILSMKILG